MIGKHVLVVWILVISVFGLSGCATKDFVIRDYSQEGQESVSVLPDSLRVESVRMKSEALGKEMALNVYLPPSYDGEQAYPVLYLLHGYSEDERTWIPELGADQHADRLIQEGRIDPLIIVSIQYDNSYGINSSETTRQLCEDCMMEGRYQDYLSQEVITYIDTHYATIDDRQSRYIGGSSMGGFTALYTAFTHPELFSKVGGHSPALWLDYWADAGGLKPWLYPNEAVRNERDPIVLAQSADLQDMEVYLDCGKEDHYRFYEGTEMLHQILQDRGVESELHLNEGKHEGAYWMEQMDRYLIFYAAP